MRRLQVDGSIEMLNRRRVEVPSPVEGEDRSLRAIFRPYRNCIVVLGFCLIVLSVLSCLPYAPQGPFDARDFTRVAGVRLELSPLEALFEPFASPILVLAGSPDFATACFYSVIWILFGAALWGMLAKFRVQNRKKPLATLIAGIRSVGIVISTLGLIGFLFVIARVPGWRLAVDNPDLIVADLHSHTTKSHDAIMSLKTNLGLHASCGYNLVGLTEHDVYFPHETEVAGDSSFDRLPPFISGVEVHTGPGAMVVGICRDSRFQFEQHGGDSPPDRTAIFSKRIHEECGGVVIALSMKRIKPGRVPELADAGVDGFEIANAGHPELRPELRQALLEVSRSRGVVLVGSTDWHGWTGLTRAWTVIRAPGSSTLSRQQRVDLAIQKIREHDTKNVIPVIAGFIGDPSPVRAIFSPFAEGLRYAQELSALRVISWWVWVWGIFGLWVLLERKGFRPEDILFLSVIGLTGLGLIIAGFSQIGEAAGTATPYPYHMGLITLAIGAVAAGCSVSGLLMRRKERAGLRSLDQTLHKEVG